MKMITVTELNRKPSAPLRDVEAGKTVIITSHGKPIARIVPISQEELEKTMEALSVTPAQWSPRSHFMVPQFLNKQSRQLYKKEKIELPKTINWSHPDLVFDMSKESSRAQLYEKVLCEGNTKEIEHFVPYKDLLRLWKIMFLPFDLQRAWESVYPDLKESYAYENTDKHRANNRKTKK